MLHPVEQSWHTRHQTSAEAGHLQGITLSREEAIEKGGGGISFYLCTTSWSPHNRSLVPQARSWSPHIWTRPLKNAEHCALLRINPRLLLHKMTQNVLSVYGAVKKKKVAAGCQPSVLLRYPLWIGDKGNYFCPAVPDYWPGGGGKHTGKQIGSDQKWKRNLSQRLAASTNGPLEEGAARILRTDVNHSESTFVALFRPRISEQISQIPEKAPFGAFMRSASRTVD